MSKQRFEAPTLDLAVQAAKDALGDSARIVGANRVRRGGVGGFFAKEYVEVEAEPCAAANSRAQGASSAGRAGAPTPGAPKTTSRATNTRMPAPKAVGASAAPVAVPALGSPFPEDALSDLIEEMAQSGPSSILDLAERVNTEQSRFALAEDNRPMGDMISAVRSSDDFAEMLQRIAAEAGLLSTENLEPPSSPSLPGEVEVHHNCAILTDLGDVARDAPKPAPATPAPAPAPAHAASPAPAQPQGLGSRHNALRQLGLPVRALPASLATGSLEQLEAELCAALDAALPPVPALPRQATSVVAVLGERKDLLGTAKALAGELGTPVDEISLATRRGVWRQQQDVISSPEAASERKRGWRWRERPAVVAIETSVHPDGDSWATSVLRALEPTMCVGVVEATRKPEDVAAWSEALGGLDALAVTDLDATTSPAALLGGPVPIASADGQPATPAFWAHRLCARLR